MKNLEPILLMLVDLMTGHQSDKILVDSKFSANCMLVQKYKPQSS